MRFEDIKWEAVAAVIAVIFSFGGIFYYIVSIEKDVERISTESQSQKSQLKENNKTIEKNKDDIKTIDKNVSIQITSINERLTAVQSKVAESSLEIRRIFERILEAKLNQKGNP